MAKVVFTLAERTRIDQIATELEGCLEEFFADAHALLAREQWEVLSCYVRACVRRSLELGALLNGLVDAQPACIEYKGRGRDVFVRQGLAAWKDAFAPVRDVWQLSSIFAVLPGGEQRALADVATLEVMAANRMFAPLDEQLSALCDPGS